jgi:DnaJ family protein C protein 17
VVDQLRRDGQELREAYAERDTQQEMERQQKIDRKAQTHALEERQVRLKWDRKKSKISPSEDSIASLLSQFGPVEKVELIGSKGNQALVTFADSSSCRPSVDAYATSKEMRAKFVGTRKDREEEQADHDDNDDKSPPSRTSERQGENLDDRRLRQAAEREALLRQMEEEEQEDDTAGGGTESQKKTSSDSRKKATAEEDLSRRLTPFPIPFPDTEAFKNLAALQKLESLERTILGDLLSSEELRVIQISSG